MSAASWILPTYQPLAGADHPDAELAGWRPLALVVQVTGRLVALGLAACVPVGAVTLIALKPAAVTSTVPGLMP